MTLLPESWPLVMRPGQPWHGSGAEPGVKKGGGGLHAEQEFEYFRPLRVGETLTVHKRQGRTWTKDGRSGVLVPPGDVEALTAAIGELLADTEQAGELGGRARERCVERYSFERVGEQLGRIAGSVGR